MYISRNFVGSGRFYALVMISGLLVYFGALRVASITDFHPTFLPVVKDGVVIVVEPDRVNEALILARRLSDRGEVVTLVAEAKLQKIEGNQFNIISPTQWKWLLASRGIGPESTLATTHIEGLGQGVSIVATRFGDQLKVITGQ